MDDSQISNLRERFEQMLQEGSSYYFEPYELKQLAYAYGQDDLVEKALQVVSHGLSIYPGNEPLLMCKAHFLLALDRSDEAEETLLNVSERTIEYYLLRSEIELCKGNEDVALEALETLVQLPDCTIEECINILDICVDLDRIDFLLHFTATVETRFDDPILYFRELALVYIDNGRCDDAIELYNKILDTNPFSSDDWLSIAKVYAIQKDFDKAIEACDFALAIKENDENVVSFKGCCLYDSERYLEAIEQFETYLNMTTDKVAAYEMLGEAYCRIEQHETAIKYLSKAVEHNSYNHNTFYQLASCYYAMGDVDNTIENLRRTIEYNVTDREARIFLGELLLQKEEYEEAYKQLSYIKRDPIEDKVAAAAYAEACIHLQRYSQALNTLCELVELEPYDTYYLFDMILCYMQLGDYEAALDWVKYVEEVSQNTDLINTFDDDLRKAWISIAERIEQLRNILKVYLDQ